MLWKIFQSFTARIKMFNNCNIIRRHFRTTPHADLNKNFIFSWIKKIIFFPNTSSPQWLRMLLSRSICVFSIQFYSTISNRCCCCRFLFYVQIFFFIIHCVVLLLILQCVYVFDGYFAIFHSIHFRHWLFSHTIWLFVRAAFLVLFYCFGRCTIIKSINAFDVNGF